MEKEKIFPRSHKDLSFKLLLSYFTTIFNPQEKTDPIFSLIYTFSELISIIISNDINKDFLTKFLYFNKKNAHNILYDNEEIILINKTIERYTLTFLFYLSLLIRDNPDLAFYQYSIDYIKQINNNQRTNNKKYEKILISKIIIELIENYKKKDEFFYEYSRNKEFLEKVKIDNEKIIKDNLSILQEIDSNLTYDIFMSKNLDEIYYDIIFNLLESNKFQIYEGTNDILSQFNLESIDITKFIFEKIKNVLNSYEKYIQENIIKKVEDLYDIKKINFYFLILKYIIKNRNYIYQIKFLKDTRKHIIKILKNDSDKIFNNELDENANQRLIYIIDILSDSNYYNQKYLIKDKKEEEGPDYKDLKQILKYYTNFHFESKKTEINNIKEIINNKNENFGQYLQDLETAKYLNDRYDIIIYIFNQQNQGASPINEKDLNIFVESWKIYEKQINDKKVKKMRKSIKTLMLNYFTNTNNKNKLLKIFGLEIYNYFIKECQELLKKEPAQKKEEKNKIDNTILKKLNEILIYYKNFYPQSQANDIILIENALHNQNMNINFENYLKYYEDAVKMNDRYEIINSLFNYKFKDKNNPKNEVYFKNVVTTWNILEKAIIDKKIKKLKKEDKKFIYDYFSNENNKKYYSKIFTQENTEYFIKEFNAANKNKEKKIIEEDELNKLKEVLKYYEYYLFKTKSHEIELLKEIIQNKNSDCKKYLEIFEIAKSMNDKYDLIKYFFESKNKDTELTEEQLEKSIKNMDQLIRCIKDRKIRKMRKEDKILFLNYFNEENNKDKWSKIFTQEDHDFFVEKEKGLNSKIIENEKMIINELNNLEQILRYYKSFLSESKKDDIVIIENSIHNGGQGINFEKYSKDLEEAKKMNDRYDIINFIFQNKNNSEEKEDFQKIVKKWEILEKQIADKKLKKMRKDDRIILLKYFNNKNNNNSLLKIFTQEEIDNFKNYSNKEKPKITEILQYYKNFYSISKKEEIEMLEKAVKEGDNAKIENYMKDYEIAKKYNERYNIMRYFFESKKMINQKFELGNYIKDWDVFEGCINDRKIKKIRRDDKRKFFNYFSDINNKEYLLKIFKQDSIEFLINETILINKLHEVLKYYNNYLFDSKENDIQLIKEEIKSLKGNINYDNYFKDYDEALKLNERYPIIKFIADSKLKDGESITEEKLKKTIETWKMLEKSINDKKLKKLKREDKEILRKYFSDEKNNENILKIFNEEIKKFVLENLCDKTKKQLEEKKNEEKGNILNIDNNKLNELKEVLDYYQNYLFESKANDIISIKNIINGKEDNINYEGYLKDYDIAKEKNEIFPIIDFMIKFNNKEKKENEIEEQIKKWESIQKCIKDKRLKKMPKQNKEIMNKLFNDEINKELLIKIFNQEIYEYVLNNNKNDNIDKNKDKIEKLKEILNYYKKFLFETKSNDINIIEDIIKNNNIIDEKYLEYEKDYEKAKIMNERYDIIKFIFESKNKNNEKLSEEIMKETIKIWETLEQTIRDQKFKKLKREDKIILVKYFSDEKNKEKLIKIFNEEIYKSTPKNINQYLNKRDIDNNKLKEVLKYYQNYLNESKKEDIFLLEKLLSKEGNNINYEEYLKDYNVAKEKNEIFHD